LGIEDFGGGTVLLTSYPAILGKQPPQTILRAVVDYLIAKDRMPVRAQVLNDLLSLMACHAAVKAGDRLTADEIASLVANVTSSMIRTTVLTAGHFASSQSSGIGPAVFEEHEDV